ncbi:hypothetical protein LLS1_37640 [Leifsonia sp. LS1]|uniref:hypothetical protein n=1 Tax=Leifsonia sp. LS1 TaxID=2828483 RepID=UPI001CFD33B3|nr:hypothetical protein [Leifsonia sp. LS1]GIT82095.1 hypothetical protein LLS1_37640 [Leifsonia sp. LS1]
MTKYTPAEIIAGGIQDTRESFADLYVELHELRQEAAYYYHRAFVDDGPEPQQEGAVDFHPSPPAFGGKDLEWPARRVRLDRLTQKGLALYVHGVCTALQERDELLRQIQDAEHDIERTVIAMDGTIAQIVNRHLRYMTVLERRTKNESESAPLTPWDVPIRQPGTDQYLPPHP